jgi:hypothetical protein
MEKSFLLTLLFLCGFVIVKAQGPGASATGNGAGNFLSPPPTIRLTVRDGSSNGKVVHSECTITTNHCCSSPNIKVQPGSVKAEKKMTNVFLPFS